MPLYRYISSFNNRSIELSVLADEIFRLEVFDIIMLMKESKSDETPTADAVEDFLRSLSRIKPSVPSVDDEPEEVKYERLENLFNHYQDRLRKLGIIQSLLVGSSTTERLGYIWNVFTKDVVLKDTKEQAYHELGELIYQLEKSTAPILPLRISHVNPSKLDVLRKQCEEKGILTEVISL